ncbi:MAG: dTDP-4-amino-4,6-dideoxygalactose transaminase [Euryarchaeota archaeon]|nr:dTDP-4-amino-4,6-dideoxygalactose transaminase [Euryarchaeota archaeon]|tara:strand:+ start:3145 stop:4275 length:1131 start_codon:yes stop_codon:yes gene_type:complete
MIRFNLPYLTGNEITRISEVYEAGHLSGDGHFTKLCSSWLETNLPCQRALLTHSCTAALEMAAILIDIKPGDEIIMPSYTFVSSANAFVLRGGVPVFVDIKEDTLNIDETLIEKAVTPKTKAILSVHYAGVACEMDTILEIAKKYNLFVIEDAAQGIMSKYKGRSLGTIGDLGCFSFHETKNIISGEGGALIINNSNLIDRAEIIREKGTDRVNFFRGTVNKYSWQDIGSSFLPGETTAAFLFAQLDQATEITKLRLEIWRKYNNFFLNYNDLGSIKIPFIPKSCEGNGHLFYLLMQSYSERTNFINFMNLYEINCIFHYIPLHSSPAGMKFGRTGSSMEITESISSRLVRLPFWIGLDTTIVTEHFTKWHCKQNS